MWMTALGRLEAGRQRRNRRATSCNAIMRELHDRTRRLPARPLGRSRWRRSARIPAPLAGPVVGFIAVLGALTGLVLLIACSNVAAMLLARALERRREVATRLAIGASRGRIMLQLLVEGLTLALAAGALSVPLARSLVSVCWRRFSRASRFRSRSSCASIRACMAICVRAWPRLTSVLFALLPALQATRFEVAPALHGAHATADRRRAWLRHGLVAAQVAMALLLLVAAGLFLRSLQAGGDHRCRLQRRATSTAADRPAHRRLSRPTPKACASSRR